MYATWNKSDVIDYEMAEKERLKTYSKTDDILYDMCKKWPKHNEFGITQAKVRIIGRVYATGLERKGKEDKFKGIYETVAELFYKNRTWIDKEIQILKKARTLSIPVCVKILELHGRMVELLREETKSHLNFRSFVSKYLHFHIPVVPIYDSQSSTVINGPGWYPWRKFEAHTAIRITEEYDPSYYKFLMQFRLYYSDLQELELNPSVRKADWFLIWSSWQ